MCFYEILGKKLLGKSGKTFVLMKLKNNILYKQSQTYTEVQ